jgi:hypothetical protein
MSNSNHSVAWFPPVPYYVNTTTCDEFGALRLGGVCWGRRIEEGGVVYVEVKDRNAKRSNERGSEFIRISRDELIAALEKL